jgi:rubrerythrin
MNTLASESVFTQAGKDIVQKVKDDNEAIALGIGIEKDSIVFYVGMKKIVPLSDQKIIDEVITQEQAHLRQLLNFKATL